MVADERRIKLRIVIKERLGGRGQVWGVCRLRCIGKDFGGSDFTMSLRGGEGLEMRIAST